MKKLITIPLIITLLLISGFMFISSSQEESEPNRRIIDMHLHAIPVEHFPQHWDEWAGFERPENDTIFMEQTLDALERFGIVKGITSGHMEFVEEFRETAPDRIIPSLMVGANELALPGFADSLEAWYERGLFEVIGEVPTQYDGIAPSDPVMHPLFAFASENDIPVGIHMGIGPPNVSFDFLPHYDLKLGNPLELEPVLKQFQELKIYIMHAGYPMLDNTLALMYMYPQVYLEISEINWLIPEVEFHRYLRTLVEAGLGDRIIYGSDHMLWPQSFAKSIESIESAEFLSEEQKNAIFYANAARFLGLND